MRGCQFSFGLIVIAAGLAVGGCADAEAQQELDFARASVERSLEAWKSGETAESLRASPNPIEFHDDDWQQAARLIDYQIVQVYHDTDGSPRCAVTLTVQRGKREPERIQETYQVVAKPKVIIARDPMS
jgi:hypothetical protein